MCDYYVYFNYSVDNQLESPPNATCACPGEVLTYTCIVNGGNFTIWGGSAFDCAKNKNLILLDHKGFNKGTSEECNDGAIIAQSVDVFGPYFISKLSVTVSIELNNKTVNCSSGSESVMLNNYGTGESSINVAGKFILWLWVSISWKDFILKFCIFMPVRSAPDIVYLSDANEENLVFSCTPGPGPAVSNSNCSSLQYNITSDCGTCPLVSSITDTKATCSDLELTTNASECYFNVSSVATVCDLLSGASSSVAVTLKGNMQ